MDLWGNMLRVSKVSMGEWFWEKKLLKFYDQKGLCVANTWFYKEEKR